MQTIVVYTSETSTRLTYVLDWLLKERLQLNFTIGTLESQLSNSSLSISYGNLAGRISIPSSGFIGQQEIIRQNPKPGDWKNIPTIFAIPDRTYTIPFDLFSAIFYLLSRYEEYQPFTPDKHGRYPATESILFKQGWLQRPIIDEWVGAFRKQLETIFNIEIPQPVFSFQPTYDIDIAYSHIFKGIKRIAAAYVKAILKGDLRQISERTQVLKKKQKDPYDSFSWLRSVHSQYGYKPVYFILCALKTTTFDKNISPKHPAMIRVIKQLAKEGRIGIHPSYYATKFDIIAKEKKTLEQTTGNVVTISRQHYIKLKIPDTYNILIENEINEDYSMGYGTHLGFRAGTGNSFLWYDLQNEKATQFRIYPFCFMDTTAHYELGLTADQAFIELIKMVNILKETGSTLITVFHNFSLGTEHQWQGWSKAYEELLIQLGFTN